MTITRRDRVIVHVDLDAFYASVEVRDAPELAGRPVAVGGTGRRSVVMAASYEARRFGVFSAMPMMRARALCRELVVVPPRMDHYVAVSRGFFGILGRWSPLVEGLSLDEAFLDLTGTFQLFGDPEQATRELRRAVRQELGLAASAGIAPVKFVAKIASDVAKPDGQLRVPADGIVAFLDPLPVGRLWGVGKVREAELHKLGIKTIGDLGRYDASALARHLGEHAAQHLSDLAHGIDNRAVVPHRDAKSIGSEETFENDISDLEQIAVQLLAQSERVAARLRDAKIVARGVTLKYKLKDFTLVTRQTVLSAPTDDGPTIYQAVRSLLYAHPPAKPIRLSGVSVHHLGHPTLPGLFEAPDVDSDKQRRLNAAMDLITKKHGGDALTRATLLNRSERPNVSEPHKLSSPAGSVDPSRAGAAAGSSAPSARPPGRAHRP